MSLKFKNIRKAHSISKTKFAEKMNVTYRTITNWEKKSGVIPSLSTMHTISKILHEPTFIILNSFYNDPDLENELDEESFIFDNKNFESPFEEYKSPSTFFTHLKQCKISNTGFIRFDTEIFSFSKKQLCPKNSPMDMGNNDTYDYHIESLFHPYSAIILADDSINTLVIHETNIQKWRIISNDYSYITFELMVNKAFCPNMLEKLLHNKAIPIYLTFKLSNYHEYTHCITDNILIRMDSDKVIPAYIKEIRLKHKLTQQEFADKLSIIPSMRIDNKTIAKWENGSLSPTRYQFLIMEQEFNFSLERLLDAFDNEYFASNSIYTYNKSYEIGLNYTFNGIKTVNDLVPTFINDFKLIYSAQNHKSANPLGYIQFYDEAYNLVHDYFVTNITKQKSNLLDISLLNEDAPTKISLKILDIYPYSLHHNYYYEVRGRYSNNSSEISYFSLTFSIFMNM